MEPRPEEDSTERRLFWAVAAVVIVVLVVVGVRKWRAHHHARYAGTQKALVAHGPSPVASVQQPTVAPPAELALEIWFRDPDALAARVLGRVAGPGVSFSQMLKAGIPPQSPIAKDIDELDFTKPLGCTILGAGTGGTTRFVWAATVKDKARAATAVESYATREGATREHSDVLKADTFKGAKTGRYLALVGNQVLLGSDKLALEQSAMRLAAGWAIATTQTHDISARAPKSWISGPFVQWVEESWTAWVAPQLGGATNGPAKALFDEIAAGAKQTWPGAEDVDIVVDVGDQTAVATATLRAADGSSLSKFLASYPTRSPDALLEAPRDALGGIALRFPTNWLETARRFMVTPPPDVKIPEDLRVKTETVFTQLNNVLEGEVLLASVADPPPVGGPGGSLMRFKLRGDEEAAKKAARDLVQFILGGAGMAPPGAPPPQLPPVTPITVDGGSGEAMEFTPAPQAGEPPLPPVGIAWAVRGGYLYVARGASPKLRVMRFASAKPEDHIVSDADVKARVGKMPGKTALALLIAPMRADTPLPALLKKPPMPQAITLSIEPTATGLTAQANLDLDLAVNMVLPMLMAPPQPPPGALPPDAASGAPASSGAVPPAMGPGIPGIPPGMMGMPKVPATPKSPPPVQPPPGGAVPPAGGGYQLPLPKHHAEP